MEFSPSDQRRNRYQFEKFCKKVIDGERADYFRPRSNKTRSDLVTLFSDLPESILNRLCTLDSDPAEQYIFRVHGYSIPIRNDRLVERLLTFADDEYAILLLYYSLEFKDWEIASLLGLSRSKIQHERTTLMKELKKKMGGQLHG